MSEGTPFSKSERKTKTSGRMHTDTATNAITSNTNNTNIDRKLTQGRTRSRAGDGICRSLGQVLWWEALHLPTHSSQHTYFTLWHTYRHFRCEPLQHLNTVLIFKNKIILAVTACWTRWTPQLGVQKHVFVHFCSVVVCYMHSLSQGHKKTSICVVIQYLYCTVTHMYSVAYSKWSRTRIDQTTECMQ